MGTGLKAQIIDKSVEQTDFGINLISGDNNIHLTASYENASGSVIASGDTQTTIVKDVTPKIVNGNTLRVEVNGVSGQVALPTGGKQLVTSGDITQFISVNTESETITVNKEFDIEYIMLVSGSSDRKVSSRITISKGTYPLPNVNYMRLGVIHIYPSGSDFTCILINDTGINVQIDGNSNTSIITSENITEFNGRSYRLYA